MTWTAVLDILIAAFVIYQALVFIQGRRAMHMVVGVGLVVLSFYLARWTRLDTVSWLLSTVLPYFVFLIIIVFQSEIRRALAHFDLLFHCRNFYLAIERFAVAIKFNVDRLSDRRRSHHRRESF